VALGLSIACMNPALQHQAFDREMSFARAALANGDTAQGWRALELAHVIGQSRFLLHLRVHMAMLGVAVRHNDLKETGAQLLRLALVPLGHMLGHLPAFNPGSGRVSALSPADWPGELDPHSLERIDPSASPRRY
jgi:hypothetical protein